MYMAATQEMVMELKNYRLVTLKLEHLNNRLGTMLYKQICFASSIK